MDKTTHYGYAFGAIGRGTAQSVCGAIVGGRNGAAPLVTAQGVCGAISRMAPLSTPRETGGLLLSLVSGFATRS